MGEAARERAGRQLREAGLSVPPLPRELVADFREFGPWRWGTRDLDPLWMYQFEDVVQVDEQTMPVDYMALCHAGHGANSYALTYHLVYRPIAVMFQVGWGGAYMKATRQAELFRRQCELSTRLVKSAARARRAASPTAELALVRYSDLRQIAAFRVLGAPGPAVDPQPMRARSPASATHPDAAYRQAWLWLRGRR